MKINKKVLGIVGAALTVLGGGAYAINKIVKNKKEYDDIVEFEPSEETEGSTEEDNQ